MLRGFASGVFDARWVMAFALVVFGGNLSVSQMRGDSMIYSAVSRNLIGAQDPLQLTLNGQPYLNKPPLYFWWTAAVMRAVGRGSVAASAVGAKLGALLASVGLCVLLYRSVRRIFDDREAGLLAVLVFSATLVVFRNTYHARMESLLTLWVFASLMCFLRWLESPRTGWLLGWGVLAGLGVLTKGPAGALSILAAVIYLLLRERGKIGGRSIAQLAAGLIVFGLSFGWWYFHALRTSDFGSVFLGEQVFSRTIFGGADEPGRWLVYARKLFGWDLLWMVAAANGARHAWRVEHLRRPVGLLLVAAATQLVLIHLVEEKTARYLYQFYAFSCALSAWGLLSWKRFAVTPVLQALLVLVAIGLQFNPPRSGHDYYGALIEAHELAGESGWPIIADWREFDRLDDQAALDYYLEETTPPAVLPESFLLVRPRSRPEPGARTLIETGRLWIGLVQGAPHGPGPAARPLDHSPDPEGP